MDMQSALTASPPMVTDDESRKGVVAAEPAAHRAQLGWVLVLLTLATAIIALRLKTYDEPLERDLITYMMVGHAMNRGGQAYVDAWDIKPPLPYAVYALAEWAVGLGEPQIYLLNVISAIATLVGVFVAASTRGRRAGLWAAAFWVLICGAPSLEANQPNTEVFINACVVWAFALLLRAGGTSGGAMRAVAIGTLFAIGTAFKQTVIVEAMLLSFVHLLFSEKLPGARRRAVRDVLIIGGIGAACWFTMLAYYFALGQFQIFWVTNFSNARAYAGNPLFNLFRYVREARFFPRILWFLAPVAGLVLLGALRDRRFLRERQWALYSTALVSLQFMVALNGQGFLPHYYQYWLPMIAIGAGWAAGAKTSQTGAFPGWIMPRAGASVAVYLLIQQGSFYLLPADKWSQLKYKNSILEMRDMGRSIGNLLRPEERLYQYGNRPELYYYSGHLAPSLLLWTQHLNDNWPAAKLLLTRHLAAIQETPPDLVVVEELDLPVSNPAQKRGLIQRLLEGDRPVNEGRNAQIVLDALLPGYRSARIVGLEKFHGFQFYVRRDSSLDRRLSSESWLSSRLE